MSIFASHIAAARKGGRVASVPVAELDTQEVIATESLSGVEESTTEVVAQEALSEPADVFAQQRAALNARVRIRPEFNSEEPTNVGEDIVVVTPESMPEVDGEEVTDVQDSGDVDFGQSAEEDIAVEDLTQEVPSEVAQEDIVQEDITQEVEVLAQEADATITEEAEPEVAVEAVEAEVVAEESAITEEAPAEVVAEATVAEIVEEASVEVSQEAEVVQELDQETADEISEDGEPVVDEDEEDDEDEYVEDESELDQLEQDTADLDALCQQMSLTMDSIVAVENFGINPTAMSIMQSYGLLNGTALETLGLEAFGFDAPDGEDSAVALEALTQKAEDTNASWAAKVLTVSKNFGKKIVAGLGSVWSVISDATKKLGSFAWDKTKMVGKTIKAHPYATIVAVIAAIAAVGGITLYCGASLPAFGAKAEAIKVFAESVVTKIKAIKWPFGDVSANVAEGAGKVSASVSSAATSAKAASAEALGWTSALAKSASTKAGQAYKAVVDGVTATGARIGKVGTSAVEQGTKAVDAVKGTAAAKSVTGAYGKVASTGDRVAMQTMLGAKALGVGNKVTSVIGSVTHFAFMSFVFSLATTVAKLVYKIAMAGLRVVASTFVSLVSATKQSAPAAA